MVQNIMDPSRGVQQKNLPEPTRSSAIPPSRSSGVRPVNAGGTGTNTPTTNDIIVTRTLQSFGRGQGTDLIA